MPYPEQDSFGMSDFGLSTPNQTSSLGQPGGTLGGPSALTQALQQAGPAPTMRGALQQTLGTPKGALAAAISLLGGSLLGGLPGAAGAVQGIGAGVQDVYAQQEQERANHLKAIQAQLEAQEKIGTRVATLLGQKPELFAGVSPVLLGNIVAPETGLVLSPSAMLAAQRNGEGQEQNIKLLLPLMKEAQGPQAKRQLATLIFANMGLKPGEPGDKDSIAPEILDQFWQQDGEFTDEQLVSNFGITGIEAARHRQETGVLPYHILRQIPKNDPNVTLAETAWSLVQKATEHQTAVARDEGRFIDLGTAAKESLTEGEIALMRKEIKEIWPELDERDAMRNYDMTIRGMGMYGAAQKGLFTTGKEFDDAVRRSVTQAMNDANTLGRIKTDESFAAVVLSIARRIQASDTDGKLTRADIVKRARAVAEQQFRAEGRKVPVPGPVSPPAQKVTQP